MTENTRSRDFRFVYANTFGFKFGPNELQLLGGIQSNPGSEDPSMEEQIGFIISHQAAKLLATVILKMIGSLEEASGAVIPLDAEKLAGLDEMINAAKADILKKASEANAASKS
jgi:hypothetical protein